MFNRQYRLQDYLLSQLLSHVTGLVSGVRVFTEVLLLARRDRVEGTESELGITESEVIMTPPVTRPAPPNPAYFNIRLNWRICTIVKTLNLNLKNKI